MVNEAYIRVWQKIDIELMKKHMIISGDPAGDCSNCREIGINISNTKICPNCGVEFKYMATRLQNNPSQAARMAAKRSDLIMVDLSDYKEALARENAKKIF